MDGRKRTVQLKFRVTEAERDLILEKMKLIPTRNMAAYLRKIAIDGYIIQIDHTKRKRRVQAIFNRCAAAREGENTEVGTRFLCLLFFCLLSSTVKMRKCQNLTQKRKNTAICGVPNGCMHEKTGVLFPRSFIFDFLYCFCCGGDNRQILVVHAVKQCFKLPPLCGLICFLVWEKELVY